jgi:hypothetical protein
MVVRLMRFEQKLNQHNENHSYFNSLANFKKKAVK